MSARREGGGGVIAWNLELDGGLIVVKIAWNLELDSLRADLGECLGCHGGEAQVG